MNKKIRTQLVLLIMVLVLPTILMAQDNGLRLNVGIPIGKYGKFDHNYYGSDESNSPSFIIQLEKDWKYDLSVGAYVGYAGQKHKFIYAEEKFNYYRFGTVVTYELDNWLSEMNLSPGYGIEIYTSLKTGFCIEHRKSSSSLDAGSNDTSNDLLFDFGMVLGSRYHFTDEFGVFTELGWGNAGFFTLGATFSL